MYAAHPHPELATPHARQRVAWLLAAASRPDPDAQGLRTAGHP